MVDLQNTVDDYVHSRLAVYHGPKGISGIQCDRLEVRSMACPEKSIEDESIF